MQSFVLLLLKIYRPFRLMVSQLTGCATSAAAIFVVVFGVPARHGIYSYHARYTVVIGQSISYRAEQMLYGREVSLQ